MKTKTELKNQSWMQFKNFTAVQSGVVLLCLTASLAPAQTYSVLHQFIYPTIPKGGVVLSGGTLYGTAKDAYDKGTLFKVNSDGSGFTTIRSFTTSDGYTPAGQLLLSGTTLYGTTTGDGDPGQSKIFKINTDGSGFTVLRSFERWGNEGYAQGGLVFSGTTLYGTTYSGGSSNRGTVFRVSTDGSGFAMLKSFTGGSDGAYPNAGLVLSDTALYGTTFGVNNKPGTIYKINTDGSGFTVLRNFGGSNSGPKAGLVLSGSTLYGTTYIGGSNNFGTVFRMDTNGNDYVVLKSFTGGIGGAYPQSGLVLSGSKLYGTTSAGGTAQDGTVFEVNTNGSGFAVLKSFTSEQNTMQSDLAWSGTAIYGALGDSSLHNSELYSLSFAPTILTPPLSQTAPIGATVSMLVGTGGYLPLAYQWFFNTTNTLASATNSFLELANVQLAQSGAYTVVVTNGFGTVTSIPAMLTVFGVPPTILSPPTNRSVGIGATAEFAVGAAGTPPLAYQWFFNESNALAGATGPVLQVTNVHPVQAGNYTAVVTNAFGTVTSSPALLIATAEPPAILAPPLSQTVPAWANVEFTVQASGSWPLSYQWFFNSTQALPDATNSLLRLVHVPPSQAGAYTVVVTNSFGAVTSSIAMLNIVLESTVTNCTEAALRAALAEGSIVTFSCDGTILLTDTITIATDKWLDGTGHQVTISGNNAVRVFYVNTNVTFTVVNLTIADGQSTNGAGIFNDGGNLNLLGTLLRSNIASASMTFSLSTEYAGGGVFNRGGTISGTNCAFVGNAAQAPGQINGTPSPARGGAILNESGLVNLQNCVFTADSASGGSCDISPGADGTGGAIHNSGTLVVTRCTFIQNSATGGPGSWWSQYVHYLPGLQGGSATGGAIYNEGVLTVDSCTLASNTVAGGNGGTGGGGYNCDDNGDMRGGNGGAGGSGIGAALFAGGVANVVNSTFAWNTAAGGAGGAGGSGGPCTRSGGVGGPGGAGTNGGSGFGAIYGGVHLTDCTLAFNTATGGSGGAGGGGGQGGYNGSNGPGGAWGTAGLAGGGINGGWLLNTLLASNTPANGSGTITDAGHNLSSDGSCVFTSIGSLNNTDPKLGPLANNGGPTMTMRLLPGSPAIDAGDNTAAPPTDQRGVPRPVGLACDIGAYECSPPILATTPPTQTAEIGSATVFRALASGFPPPTYQWFFNGNALTGCTSFVLCLSNVGPSHVGAYAVVVSDVYGSVTSAPAMLNVIPAVARRPVLGVKVTGEVGSLLNVEYASSLSPSSNWTTLGSVSLTSTSQFCPDLTTPLPPERFYRAWQTGTPGVVPSLNLNFVPAIMLTGKVGDSLHLDCINAIGPTNAWVTLATVTLTNTSQLYFDVSAPGQPARLYRIVPVP